MTDRKDYLIAQFVKDYSKISEFFDEAVRLKVIQISRITTGKYANHGLTITGKEKAIRYFLLKPKYESIIWTIMRKYSIPEISIGTSKKILKTVNVVRDFDPNHFYADPYPSILILIGRIADIIREEGYLIGDVTSGASRSLNFDVFDLNISRSRDRWKVDIWVCNYVLGERVWDFVKRWFPWEFVEIKLSVANDEFGKVKLLRGPLSKLRTMSQQSKLQIPTFTTSIPGLKKTTFPEFFQFLSEEAEKGRFWMVFDNLTDRCLFLTDNAEPGRLTVPTNQYIGVNRFEAWRDSLDDYHRLKHLLATEKIAPSFEANMYRLNGSFAHYQKTCYLIEGLWGTQCLASISEGWELLRPANKWND